jgi:hypothetical protein
MASSTLRRRLYHGDVDGRSNEQMDASGADGLDEPLLGSYGDRSKVILMFQIMKVFCKLHQLFCHLQLDLIILQICKYHLRTLQMITKTRVLKYIYIYI